MLGYIVAIVLATFLVFAPVSHAVDVVITGTEVAYTYTEPTTNSDGSPLNDLQRICVYYDLNGGTSVKVLDEPATSKNGGGTKTVKFMVPITESMETVLHFWSTAIDESGNTSANSVVLVKRIDKLAPAAPQ